MHGGLHHKEARTHAFDQFMYIVAVLMPAALLPQTVKVFTTHDVTGLSLITWSILILANLAWSVYGIIHKEWAVFISNALMTLLEIAVVTGIFWYS